VEGCLRFAAEKGALSLLGPRALGAEAATRRTGFRLVGARARGEPILSCSSKIVGALVAGSSPGRKTE
jgi:hypothetical protein